jgi:hypothetical protein
MIDLNDFKIKKMGSTRKCYRMTCNTCGIDRGYQRKPGKSSKNLGLCRSCASTQIHTGRVVSEETKALMKQNNYLNNGGAHPWIGRKHSEATKKQLSTKQADWCKTNGNQFVGHTHTQAAIEKISANNSGKEPRWKGRVFQYDGPKGIFKMRSSYELAYANWMDSQDVWWKYEPQFKLSNGKTFSPDFQLKHGDIIEIKGYWAKVGLEKWTLFCSDYPEIKKEVLMKADLQKLNII